MMVIAAPTVWSLIAGALLVAAGEAIRLWGVAIAGSETRTTGPVGGSFLITTGPFAYVRNPLYLGNLIMYTGVGIMANAPILALGAFVFFFGQYSLIVSLEEEYLRNTFTKEYIDYCSAVPRFVPTLHPYTGGVHEQPGLNWMRGLRSESRTLQAIVILILVLAGRWWVSR